MIRRFQDYEIDDVEGVLRRHGRMIPLEPKVFALLELLSRHPGRTLGRDLLIHTLWPGVHVSRCSLTRLVKEARRAVGDDGATQHVIRTRRGLGYAFVAPIEGHARSTGRDPKLQIVMAARGALLASIDHGVADLRGHVDEFVRVCRLAIEDERP